MICKSLVTLALASVMSSALASPDLFYKFQWRETVNGQVKVLNQFQVMTASHTVDRYSATKNMSFVSSCVNGTDKTNTSYFEVGHQLQLIALGMESNNKVMTDIDYELTELNDKYTPVKGCGVELLNVYTLRGKAKMAAELDQPTTVTTTDMGNGREISLVMTVSKAK